MNILIFGCGSIGTHHAHAARSLNFKVFITDINSIQMEYMKNKLYPTMIKKEVELAEKYLKALPDKILSVGRMGTYRYVDIDDIIMQALEFKKTV